MIGHMKMKSDLFGMNFIALVVEMMGKGCISGLTDQKN